MRKFLFVVLVMVLAFTLAGCRKNKSQNPIADLDSKQPDKVLFDRAMEALKKNRFDVARITLQTLINTYPDSEYIARAKLSVGDSWYEEGGSAALAQAEVEYKDFQTFFPNMPEAAEAQLKVAYIHYRQMQKPDRDYTHAKRAEDEYKQLLEMYPDSPHVTEAKQRLREVQEVLAEREFRIGRFYHLRESYPAAIARLKTLTDTYPLYSQADEALLMLGDAHEAQANLVRASALGEVQKANLLKQIEDRAATAYERVITRYPVTESADEAKKRLQALNRQVPQPTEQMIAQNRAEEESRGKLGTFSRVMLNLKQRPDTAPTAKVGEPTMTEPPQTSAPALVRQITSDVADTSAVTAETGSGDKVELKSQPVPRSDDGSGETTAQPPAQVNEAAEPPAQATNEAKPEGKDDKQSSSSKKKKKSVFRKMIPF